jgi:hypothetical protein
MTQEVGSQKRKCGQSTNLGALRSKIGVRLIAEELNMHREIVRQIVTEDLGMRNISAKMVPRILIDDQKRTQFHFPCDFYRMQRSLIGSLPGVFSTTRKQNAREFSEQHRIHLICLARSSSPCLCVSSITRGQFTMNSLHTAKP